MRLLLLLLFTATSLFSQANTLFKDEGGSSMTIGCVIMVPVICTLIAGAVYFANRNNKRRDK